MLFFGKCRTSNQRCCIKIPYLKVSRYSQENACVGIYGASCHFIKRRLQYRYFPVNIAKFLRASIFSEENLQTTASENEQMYLNIVFVFDPADTGRKLNVHKTFRRRSGRLLNVLCTFNLRPVSTGELLQVLLKFVKVFGV